MAKQKKKISTQHKNAFESKYFILYSSVIGTTLSILVAFLWNLYYKKAEINNLNNWSADKSYRSSLQVHMGSLDVCDLPVYDLKLRPHDINLINSNALQYPFLLRNSISHWKAFERWSKKNFSRFYGQEIVHIGTESSIAYGGGGSVIPIRVQDYLEHLDRVRNIYRNTRDTISFATNPIEFIETSISNMFPHTSRISHGVNHHHHDHRSKDTMNASNSNTIHDTNATVHAMDSFVFDITILNTLYALKNDFRIPKFFLDWDNPNTYKGGTVYHMLSLGSSRTGLPFHYHGHTWMGLVYGSKLWLMYPPGLSPPERFDREYNPLNPVKQWLRDIFPLLKHFPRPWKFIRDHVTGAYEPINPDEAGQPITNLSAAKKASYIAREVGGDYRPLQCLQEAGDILYLPEGWLHMTVNVGETIAVGGQAYLTAKRRYELSLSTLELYPESFDALKGVGISAAHMAMEVMEQSREYSQQLMISKFTLKARLHEHFSVMVDQSEGIWLVLFYTQQSKDILEMQKLWVSISSRLQGMISLAIFDITHIDEEELAALYGVNKTEVNVNNTDIRLFPGGARPSTIHRNISTATQSFDENSSYKEPISSLDVNVYEMDVDLFERHKLQLYTQGIRYDGTRESALNISDFALDLLMNPNLRFQHGCLGTISAKARRLFKESERHLRRALLHKPLHPEVRGALAEVLGHAGEPTDMGRIINITVKMYEAFTEGTLDASSTSSSSSSSAEESMYEDSGNDEDDDLSDEDGSGALIRRLRHQTHHVSHASLASLYHRLGTIYLSLRGQQDVKDSLYLFEKALKIDPAFVPAVADAVRVHLHLNHTTEAVSMVARLSRLSPGHPQLTHLRKKINNMLETNRLG